MKRKLHPVAKKMGYKSNEDFYNDFPTQEAYEQHMAKGGVVKYADGGITDADRQSYNNYVGGMKKLPGYDAVNWQTDQTFQKNAANQLGFDYSKASAIQADMMARNQSMPGSIAGVQQGDAWGGDPNWVGNRERQKSYRKFEYSHIGRDGKEIGHIDPSFNALTKAQSDDWANYNRGQQWQSNDQNIPMPSNVPWTPKPTPVIDNTQAIASRQMREADNTGRYDNMYESGPEQSYSIDNIRANQSEQYDMAYGGKVRRKIKKMGSGDLVTSDNPIGGATQLNVSPTGTGPNGDSRWSTSNTQPKPTAPVQPGIIPEEAITQDPNAPANAPSKRREFNVGADLNLNTTGLISAANMLVTNNIYNPQIRAMEANRQRAGMQRVQNNNDFNGGDMLTYAQGGNIVDDYTTHPGYAKEEIEGGEGVRLPDGSFDMAQGPKHYEGGIPTNLPESTEVFSAQMYADKKFVSDITNNKTKKKMKIADLANKFNSKKEEEVLSNKKSDPIAKRTAEINMNYNQSAQDQIFNYQEMMKDPIGSVRQMAMGGKKRCYAPGGLINVEPGPSETWEDAHPSGDYPIPGMVMLNENQPLSPNYPIPGAVNMPTMPQRDIVSPGYPTTDMPEYIDAPTDNSYENLTPYAGNRTTSVVDTPKSKEIKRKKLINLNESGVPGFVPQAMAAVNAITQSPINVGRMQPAYSSRPEELNIDPILNRNLAQSRAYMTGNSGNASIDRARALQGLAATQNADEQAYANKFNVDAQRKDAWRKGNADIKNQAELYNLQAQDAYWNKSTQRQANKEAAFQAIANNAYTNSRKRLYDKHAQALVQEFSPNYKYDPSSGFTFVPGSDGQFHMVPIGGSSNSIYNQGDGIKTSESITIDGKGNKKRKINKSENTKN